MNKRIIKKHQGSTRKGRTENKIAVIKEITYQEAWNKVAEYMSITGEISFCVNPWSTDSVLDEGCESKFCLATLDNGKYRNHFIADKEWK